MKRRNTGMFVLLIAARCCFGSVRLSGNDGWAKGVGKDVSEKYKSLR